MTSLAKSLEPELRANFDRCCPVPGEPYSPDPASKAKRSLRNSCLMLLAKLKTDEVSKLCVRCYNNATNMTDSFAALVAGASIEVRGREREFGPGQLDVSVVAFLMVLGILGFRVKNLQFEG